MSKITSQEIKTELFYKYRYDKQFEYVCSEFGMFNADFVACNKLLFIEFEIKTSYSDFKADFSKKKHQIYFNESLQNPYRKLFIPHQFYFVVPEKIYDKCKKYLLTKNEYYGIIIYNEDKILYINKRAKHIHKNPIKQQTLNRIVKRMGSELAISYKNNLELLEEIKIWRNKNENN